LITFENIIYSNIFSEISIKKLQVSFKSREPKPAPVRKRRARRNSKAKEILSGCVLEEVPPG
jgi:hypothetical protein